MPTPTRAILAALATLPLWGCAEGPRSCGISSASLVMFATAIDGGEGVVEVEVEFETATDSLDNTGTSLELCPDSDRLEINGATPEEVRALGHLYYVAELASQSEITITLERANNEQIEVTVEMPPDFSITSPSAGDSHSRAAELALSWAPEWPEHQAALSIGDKIGSLCIEGLGYDAIIDDTGELLLPEETLVSGADGGSCEVKLNLTRIQEAAYPAELGPGGNIIAIVNRQQPFNSTD